MVNIVGSKENMEVRVVRLQRQLHEQERQVDHDGRHQNEAHMVSAAKQGDRFSVLHNCLSTGRKNTMLWIHVIYCVA
jgi:hypothetical protein